jgi:hypothetical protein
VAYTPSLNDIHDLMPQQSAGGYTPSMADVQDLMPGQSAQQAQAAPQPAASVPRGNVAQSGFMSYFNAPKDMSPTMADITAFNTGAGRLAHGILQPFLEGSNDKLAQASRDVAARREANYKTAKDIDPTGASIAEFVGNAALPAILTRGTGWLAGPATGAVIGAANYVNPGESRLANAGFGAAGGLLGTGLGKLFDTSGRKIAEKYAKSAMPGLVAKATDKIKNYITPEQAAQKLQANFNKADVTNTLNWNKANTLAQTLDNHLTTQGKAFDASPFAQHLQDFSEKTKKMEPAIRAKYDQARMFANEIQEQTPQSFAGVVSLRQNLNEELKKFLDKNNIKIADTETKSLITGLKGALQNTVDANAGKVDNKILDQFKNSWKDANQSHQYLQEFYNAPDTAGTLKAARPQRKSLQAGTQDRASIKPYVRPTIGGTTGINQLNKLTGNDDAARSYIMRDVMEGRGNPNDALTNYEKLSKPQRERLFDSLPEGQQLKAASLVRNTFPAPSSDKLTLELIKHKLGGMAGTVGTLGIPNMAAKFATPSSVMRAVNRAQTPNQKAGRYLSPVLANLFASMGDNS